MAPIQGYATPGIYVEEISTLPPSVAEIATAIPAFIGYTEKHAGDQPMIKEIRSLRDYEESFGQAPSAPWKIIVTETETEPEAKQFTYEIHDYDGKPIPIFSKPTFLLWYAIDLYFRNGGGRCFVVSVGVTDGVTDGDSAPDDVFKKDKFREGIKELEKADDPTLVIIPEATQLTAESDYGEVCRAALTHAYDMKDRFVILDTKTDIAQTPTDAAKELRNTVGTSHLERGAAYYPDLNTTLNHRTIEDKIQVEIKTNAQDTSDSKPLASLRSNENDIHYHKIIKLLADQRVILPPSAAIAGVYASVDRDRGIWKAPANISLQAVVGPVIHVTATDQAELNIHDTGKSINAIRSFSGAGTLVWGARTLDGNSNEWKFIPVRRLFITVEESVKKATAFAVFEPNDVSTWLKVKGMIDSYLYTLWERGALQGTKAEQAYFVNVGLGKTMTAADISAGRLIVEIGLAAVRPAEFIILRFSHKLAE